MRKSERRAKAWESLLGLACEGKVEIYYRGVDDKERPLFEIRQPTRSASNQLVALNATEEEVLKALGCQVAA